MNLETLAERHCTAQNLAHGTYMFGLPQLRELIKEVVGGKVGYISDEGSFMAATTHPHWHTPLYAINLEVV